MSNLGDGDESAFACGDHGPDHDRGGLSGVSRSPPSARRPQDVKYHGEPSTLTIGPNDDNPRACHHQSRHRGRPYGDQGRRQLPADDRRSMSLTTVNSATMSRSSTAQLSAVTSRSARAPSSAACRPSTNSCALAPTRSSAACPASPPTSSRSAWPWAIAPTSSGLNIVGLKRKGFPREQIHELRQAYRMLFSSEGTLKERLEDVESMFAANPLVEADHRLHEDGIRSLVLRPEQRRSRRRRPDGAADPCPRQSRSKARSESSPGRVRFRALLAEAASARGFPLHIVGIRGEARDEIETVSAYLGQVG